MSLIELVVGIALASGVALALGHVVTQMTRGVTSLEQRSQRQTEAALAMLRLRSELREATSIATLTSRRITFTHPDVSGDGVRDVITYDWDGTAGSPLTRDMNGGGSSTVLDPCGGFRLTSLSQFSSSEELLAGHVGYPMGTVANPQEITITSTTWAAQVFSLSRSGASSFRVTQVRLYMRPISAVGSVIVGLRQVVISDPAPTSVEFVSRPIAQLNPSGGWESFRLGTNTQLALGTSYAIVVRCNSSTGSVGLRYDQIAQNVPTSSTDYYRYSTNSGTTWQPLTGMAAQDLNYLIYGRWLGSTGASQTISTGSVSGVEVYLETGTGSSLVRMDTAVHCVNQPEQVQ